MTKIVSINKKEYFVEDNEFIKVITHSEFNNLIILENLGIQERIISLLKEISKLGKLSLKCLNISHGGYIPLQLSCHYEKINVITQNNHHNNLLKNISLIKNIYSNFTDKKNDVLFIYNVIINLEEDDIPNILLCPTDLKFERSNYFSYKLSESDLSLHIISEYHEKFLKEFYYYINNDNILNYDNLLHLTMIIKNGGELFEKALIQNLPYIDRWTILDTGSTDNTIDIINKYLVGKKKGDLYQEPFINFRDSRNRCLELAGTSCKFIIMLDDTYEIKENLRNFLFTVRGDQFSDSFSIFIKSNDSEYGSNRIIKSETKLKYIYKLHEVINPVNNINVIIPIHHGFLFDHRADYMEKRTMDRKNYDLIILHEMVNDEPDVSRSLYYLGQTYNLLERYESAYEFFIKRIDHHDEGFIQEKIDACFEAARICNFKLNKPWNICEGLYKRAYEMDKSRPDSLYFLGIHYYLDKDYETAYKYMKEAFIVGYPAHCQYSLKPTLSFYYLPKFVTELSFIMNDINLGKESCDLFLSKNKENESIDYYTMTCWNKIFLNILSLQEQQISYKPYKPYLVFLVDGGFDLWTGRDIEKNGVGGSETFVIEIARYIQKNGEFNVVVFCNCEDNDIYEGVEYRMIKEYSSFICNNEIHTCVISRYPEYLPVTYSCNNVLNVYLILHDLIRDGEVIIRNNKLRNILCLSDWHCEMFKSMFPILSDLVIPFSYGVDFNLFNKSNGKQKYKFIYSSFPHRGLLPLLQMWPKIHNKYPSAELYIHCDLDGKWINSVRPNEIINIKELLSKYPHGIIYEGWTDKIKLAQNWLSTDIWFYPCTFLETFCLTALEAAITNTLVITNNLGALKNTVGNRGIIIDIMGNDAYSTEWQEEALKQLFNIIDDDERKKVYLKKNYDWASELSWQNRSKMFIELINK